MQQRTRDVIRDVCDHTPGALAGEERFQVELQRVSMDDGEVSVGDLSRKLLLEAREKILVKLDRNHPCAGRQQAFGQHAEARPDLQHRLPWSDTACSDDCVACLQIDKEVLAQMLLRRVSCNEAPGGAATRGGAHDGTSAPNGHAALTFKPRPGSCSVTRPSLRAACAAAPIMAALSVHQRAGGTLSGR